MTSDSGSGSGTGGGGGDGHHEAAIDVALPFLLVSVIFGVFARLGLQMLPKSFRPPYSVTLFLLGFGSAAMGNAWTYGTVGRSLVSWQTVHPHGILYAMLPPLLFESSFDMDFHVFWRVAGQAVILASAGVAVSVALTAMVIKFMFVEYAWDWGTSLLLGSILSATDPVAVVAVLQTLGAPKKLSALIEGESLLNDGTAFVLFLIFQKIVANEELTGGGAIVLFAQLSFGGPLFGYLGALLYIQFVRRVWNDKFVEVSSLTVVVFGTFYAAETGFKVSGVLAVVVFGLMMSRSGKYALSREVEHQNHMWWSEVGWLANTIIFVLAGVVIFRETVVISDVANDPLNWGYLIMMYVMLHVIRTIAVFMFFPCLRHMGYGLSWKEGVIMVWGGLRGAVGLALGLLVELDDRIPIRTRHLINFHVAGIVILTLLVNGTTAAWVYNKLNIYQVNPFKEVLVHRALDMLERGVDEHIRTVKSTWMHSNAPARWTLVQQLIPTFTDVEVVNGRIESNQEDVHAVFLHHINRMRLHALFHTAVLGVKTMGASNRVMGPAAAEGGSARDKLKRAGAAAAGAGETKEGAETPPVPVITVTAPPRSFDAADMRLTEEALKSRDRKQIAAASAERDSEHGSGGAKRRDRAASKDVDRDGAGSVTESIAESYVDSIVDDGSVARSGTDAESERGSATNVRERRKSSDGLLLKHRPSAARMLVEEAAVPGAVRAVRKKTTPGHQAYNQVEETYQALFNAFKAGFEHHYEMRFLGDSALLACVEGCDMGLEYVKARYSISGFRGAKNIRTMLSDFPNPFAAMWDTMSKGLEIDPRLFKWEKSAPIGLRTLAQHLVFNALTSNVEALQGFIHIAGEVIDDPDLLQMIGTISGEVDAVIGLAKARLKTLQNAHVGICVVVRTLLPAKVVLHMVRERITELHEIHGLIDEPIRDDLLEMVDKRLSSLYGYYPGPRELHFMKFVSTQDDDLKARYVAPRKLTTVRVHPQPSAIEEGDEEAMVKAEAELVGDAEKAHETAVARGTDESAPT